MFKKIYRYFFPRNVDTLISGVTKLIASLEDHRQEMMCKKDALSDKMAEMTIQAQQTTVEIMRAQAIKKNLEDLMAPGEVKV